MDPDSFDEGQQGKPVHVSDAIEPSRFFIPEMKVTQVTASVGWIRIGTGAGYRSVSMSGERNKSGDDRKLHGGGQGFVQAGTPPDGVARILILVQYQILFKQPHRCNCNDGQIVSWFLGSTLTDP